MESDPHITPRATQTVSGDGSDDEETALTAGTFMAEAAAVARTTLLSLSL